MSYKNNTIKIFSSNVCQNCGDKGHHVKECSNPKTSYGIILFKKEDEINRFLMIRRRNTIGFVEFLRGQYVYSDIDYLEKLIDVMTNDEIELIKTKPFDFLWEYLWLDNHFNKSSNKIKKNMVIARDKFNKIKNGYNIGDKNIDIEILCNNKKSIYTEQEWGFPKGRRTHNESDYETAVREFKEETQIDEDDFNILFNNKTFIEKYKSYDNVIYKNVYYLAEYIGNNELKINLDDKSQFTEVSDIGFFEIDDAISKIRDYSQEKKTLLKNVNKFISS